MKQIIIEKISKLLTTDGNNNAKLVVLEETENGCLICVSHKVGDEGYLQLFRNGKKIRAHRLVYEHFYGPIPEGMDVCHRCDNPPCLRPEHFFAGTHADNMRDKAKKCRAIRGEKHGRAKLTDKKVFSIRKKQRTGKYTLEQLGQEYGVHRVIIGRIVRNKSWTHI